MATFNGERFLEEQLESIAVQSRPPYELVVSDDGSSDATVSIIERFARRAPFPVHLERNPTALGYGENFMRAAARCSGDWIAFCDQDDIWLPNKLNRCAKAIEAGPPDLRLIVHEAEVAGANLNSTGRLYGWRRDELKPRLTLSPEWFSLGLTQVFSADLVRLLPTSPRLSFRWHAHREAHDVWIALLAGCTGSILLLSEALLIYRRHDQTVTTSGPQKRIVRITEAMRNNGSQYQARADYIEEAAKRLQKLAESDPGGPFYEYLSDAAREIGRYAATMRIRASAYRARSPLAAARVVIRLGLKGAYSDSRWPFGARRFLKDLALAVLRWKISEAE